MSELSEFDKLYQELVRDITSLIDQLRQNVGLIIHNASKDASDKEIQKYLAKNPSTNRPTSLPWFKHGVKGFLSKLWYGNHSSNPMWRNEGVAGTLTLEHYSYIQEQSQVAVSIILEEVTVESGANESHVADLIKFFDEFKNKFISIVHAYMQKAAELKRPDADTISNTHEKPDYINDDEHGNEDEPAPGTVGELAKKSDEWFKSEGIKDEEKKSIRNWLNPDTNEFEDHMRPKAVNFMFSRNLYPHKSEDVVKVWPTHNKPITSGKGISSPKSMIGVTKESVSYEEYDKMAAEKIMEGASLTARKIYYTSLLRFGIH